MEIRKCAAEATGTFWLTFAPLAIGLCLTPPASAE